MNNDELKKLLPGYFQGISRVIISYPFDYIRLNLQINNNEKILSFFKKNYKNLYRGLSFPLLTVPFDRAITFYTYEKLKKHKNSSFISSIVPSFISNIYMTPINLLNTNYIYDNKINIKNLLKQNINSKLFSGFGIEVLRNTLSGFLFLYSYSYYNTFINIPLIDGSLASITMWTILYPLDTIKAHKFIYKNSYIDIIKLNSLKKLYSGILLVYLRAFPSAGIGMLIYDIINKKITT